MTPPEAAYGWTHHPAPLTSHTDPETVKLHMNWSGILSLISDTLRWREFVFCFFSYSAQFCSESASWSQCLQCFCSCFAALGQEAIKAPAPPGTERCFSANVSALLCHYVLGGDDLQSPVWPTRPSAFLFPTRYYYYYYYCYYYYGYDRSSAESVTYLNVCRDAVITKISSLNSD